MTAPKEANMDNPLTPEDEAQLREVVARMMSENPDKGVIDVVWVADLLASLDAARAPSASEDVGLRSVEIRATHPYGFRSGEWATLIGVEWANERPCYRVRFPDGKTDSWVIHDPSDAYEFRAALRAASPTPSEDGLRVSVPLGDVAKVMEGHERMGERIDRIEVLVTEVDRLVSAARAWRDEGGTMRQRQAAEEAFWQALTDYESAAETGLSRAASPTPETPRPHFDAALDANLRRRYDDVIARLDAPKMGNPKYGMDRRAIEIELRRVALDAILLAEARATPETPPDAELVAAWVERFKERHPSDDEDYGYNHAVDDIVRELRSPIPDGEIGPLRATGTYWATPETRDEQCHWEHRKHGCGVRVSEHGPDMHAPVRATPETPQDADAANERLYDDFARAVRERDRATPETPSLDVERAAIEAAARLEGEVSRLRAELAACSEAYARLAVKPDDAP